MGQGERSVVAVFAQSRPILWGGRAVAVALVRQYRVGAAGARGDWAAPATRRVGHLGGRRDAVAGQFAAPGAGGCAGDAVAGHHA